PHCMPDLASNDFSSKAEVGKLRSIITVMAKPAKALRGARVVLRRARDADAPALTAVLADPKVALWWGDVSEAELRRDIRRRNPANFVIEVDGAVAGLLQYHEELD